MDDNADECSQSRELQFVQARKPSRVLSLAHGNAGNLIQRRPKDQINLIFLEHSRQKFVCKQLWDWSSWKKSLLNIHTHCHTLFPSVFWHGWFLGFWESKTCIWRDDQVEFIFFHHQWCKVSLPPKLGSKFHLCKIFILWFWQLFFSAAFLSTAKSWKGFSLSLLHCFIV